MRMMGSLGSDVLVLNLTCPSAAALIFLFNIVLRPYPYHLNVLISINTRGVDKSPQWGLGTRGDLG